MPQLVKVSEVHRKAVKPYFSWRSNDSQQLYFGHHLIKYLQLTETVASEMLALCSTQSCLNMSLSILAALSERGIYR